MDRRKNYYMVLDTETAPLDNTVEGVDAKNMVCYDVGFAVVDKKGTVYETYSFVIKEIFFNNNLMRSAYYYNKVPQYLAEILEGNRIIDTFINVKNKLFEVFEKWNCKAVICHNALFDFYALSTTQKFLGYGKYFFPYNFEVWDTLKMVRDILQNRKSYISFCEENGYLTKHKKPRVRLTAEIIFRYITDNTDFIEKHTGLEDVLIEKEIFAFCIKQHKKMRKKLWTR